MHIILLSLISLRRDWRSGELRLIVFALIIAVASVSSVSFFTDRVQKMTEQQATELLAADLVVLSTEPIASDISSMASEYGLLTANTVNFRSMIVAGDKLKMAEVKAHLL